MVVHTAFRSQATGEYYPAGFYLFQSEYDTLSAGDRDFVDLPEPDALEPFGGPGGDEPEYRDDFYK